MNSFILRVFLPCAIGLLPSIAHAAGVFAVPASDKSMQYLGMVFGTVGSLPIQGTGNPLFGQLMYIFNQIIFALGLVIIIVTTIMGTISTVQEGEIMGKKFSSVWIPVRAGVGMYLLLPSTSLGYNWIQVGVMWLIIQGVGAANALWEQVIYSNQTQGNVVADTRKATLSNADTFKAVNLIFNCIMCMDAVNSAMLSDPDVAAKMNDEPISVYRFGDKIQFGQQSKSNAICGSINIPSIQNKILLKSDLMNSDTNVERRKQIMADAIMLAETAIAPSAAEALHTPDPNDWSYFNGLVSGARALQQAVESLSTTFTSLDDTNQQAIADGWIHAGSYYFQLVSGGSFSNTPVVLTGTSFDTTALQTALGPDANLLIANIGTQTKEYFDKVQESMKSGQLQSLAPSERAGGSLVPISVSAGSGKSVFDKIFSAIFGGSFFSDMATKLGQHVVTGCLSSSQDPNKQKNDPIVCMASFGADICSSIEVIFWTSLTTIFLIWLASSSASCMQPMAYASNIVLTILIPVASLLILLLWVGGVTLALYIPLIPFLVFTFSALSWIILVIEAMIGAPLIALMLLLPSEDEIGKASKAMVILLGLILRPMLMILGFIFGIQLLIVAIGMLNFGFASTLQMSIPNGVGLFGFASVFLLYVGIAVSLVHECFSLIYVLPDKVLRWMGEHGESTDVGGKVKEQEGAVSKGAAYGTTMVGGLKSAGGMLKSKTKGKSGGGVGI